MLFYVCYFLQWTNRQKIVSSPVAFIKYLHLKIVYYWYLINMFDFIKRNKWYNYEKTKFSD